MNGADYNDLEKKLAKKEGLDLIKNSGRGLNKGDAKSDILLIDFKFTESDSFSLNFKKWLRHTKDAGRVNLEGIFVTVFQKYNDRKVAMVDWEFLKDLIEYKGKYEDLCR